jgi:hypothetical protein
MVLRLLGSWHREDPNFFWWNSCLHFSTKLLTCSGNVYCGAPPSIGVARKILAAGTKFSDVSMAGPSGVLVTSQNSHFGM